MKKITPWLISMAVALTSTVCFFEPQAAAPAQTTTIKREESTQPAAAYPTDQPALPPNPESTEGLEAATAAYDQLSPVLLRDDLVKLYERDPDGDGEAERLQYYLPQETIEPRVYNYPSLVYDLKADGNVVRSMELVFTNHNLAPRSISYVYEIPKEFAANVDELSFSSPPAEIINPDPIIRLEFTLGAREEASLPPANLNAGFLDAPTKPTPTASPAEKVFAFTRTISDLMEDDAARTSIRNQTYAMLKSYCKNRSDAKERSSCFLNLMEEFHDLMKVDEKKEICDKTTGLDMVFCDAAADDSFDPCYASGMNEFGVDICVAYMVNRKCAGEEAEKMDGCRNGLAREKSSIVGCLMVDDISLENSCLAEVLKKPAYCERIKDPATKKTCLDRMLALGLVAPPAQPKPPAQPEQNEEAPKTYVPHFQTVLNEMYCTQIGESGPFQGNFGYTLATSKDTALDCKFERKEKINTLETVSVTVETYESPAAAQVVWNNSAGPDSAAYSDLKARQLNGQQVTAEYIPAGAKAEDGEVAFISNETRMEGKQKYSINLSVQLKDNCLIIYSHKMLQSGEDENYFTGVVKTAIEILEELSKPPP